MTRLLYALVLGLVGAGVVHGAIVLALPALASGTVWQVVGGAAPAGAFGPVPALARTRAGLVDPWFREAACRYDLDDGPVRFTADGAVPFWSIVLVDAGGTLEFGLNDRAAAGGRLDVTVARRVDAIELRKGEGEALAGTILTELPVARGFALLRVFVPDATWEPEAQRFLASARCDPVPVEAESASPETPAGAPAGAPAGPPPGDLAPVSGAAPVNAPPRVPVRPAR